MGVSEVRACVAGPLFTNNSSSSLNRNSLAPYLIPILGSFLTRINKFGLDISPSRNLAPTERRIKVEFLPLPEDC